MLFSGAPLAVPVVWRGPFCGDSEATVQGYMRAYNEGKMGQLAPSPAFAQNQ